MYMFRVAALPLVAAVALAAPAMAQTSPVLVADLTTSRLESQPIAAWVDARADLAVFTVTTPNEGRELWISDGTMPGTRLAHATVPGPESTLSGRPILAGTTAYFTTVDGPRTWSLWGMNTQTLQVSLVKAFDGATSTIPRRWDAVNGRLLFVAALSAGGDRVLWTSDGTAAGTVPLRRGIVETGEVLDRASSPSGATSALASTAGLLVTDGTPAGTSRVASSLGTNTVLRAAWAGPNRLFALAGGGLAAYSVNLTTAAVTSIAGPGNGSPLISTADGLYFLNLGQQLRLLPPDPAAAIVVVPTPPDLLGAPIVGLATSGSRLLVWSTTRMVAVAGQTSALLADLGASGVVFRRDPPARVEAGMLAGIDVPGSQSPTGERRREWLLTEGTAAGTRRLTGPGEGRLQFNQSTPRALGGRMVQARGYRVDAATRRTQLYALDDGAGAQIIDDATVPLAPDAWARPLGTVNGGLAYLMSSDDQGTRLRSASPALVTADLAQTPRATDPTEVLGSAAAGDGQSAVVYARNRSLGLFATRVGASGVASTPEAIGQGFVYADGPFELNGRAVFIGTAGGPGRDLWISDGTASGTVRLTTFAESGINGNGVSGVAGSIGGRLLFSARGGVPAIVGLFATAGQPGDAELLAEGFAATARDQVFVQPDGAGGEVMVFSGVRLLSGGGLRFEVFRTDGTPAGTASLTPSPASSFPASLTPLVGAVYASRGAPSNDLVFLAPYTAPGVGPAPGQSQLRDGFRLGDVTVASVAAARSTVGAIGVDLSFIDLLPGVSSSSLGRPAAVLSSGAAVVSVNFAETFRQENTELLISSGTPQGTSIFETVPGPDNGVPTDLYSAGNRAFFSAAAPGRGQELWSSDGTPAGTRLVAELWRGPTGSVPGAFFRAGARVIFMAQTPDVGAELYSISACAADFNADGVGNIYDLLEYLHAWFNDAPGVDVLPDGARTVGDLFAYLSMWFSGC